MLDHKINNMRTILSVKFPDGTYFNEVTAISTMIECLKKIGLEKAAEFKDKLFHGYPLVSKDRRMDDNKKWQRYLDGWYI